MSNHNSVYTPDFYLPPPSSFTSRAVSPGAKGQPIKPHPLRRHLSFLQKIPLQLPPPNRCHRGDGVFYFLVVLPWVHAPSHLVVEPTKLKWGKWRMKIAFTCSLLLTLLQIILLHLFPNHCHYPGDNGHFHLLLFVFWHMLKFALF